MRVSRWKWPLRALFTGIFIFGGWLATRNPAAGLLLVAFPTAVFGVSFWAQRNNERIAAAAKAGDLDAIEAIARNHVTSRYLALITLAMHGGVRRVRDLGDRVFCVCGECELDENDRELQTAIRALELVENEKAKEACSLLRKLPIGPKVLPPAPALRVAILVFSKLMSGAMLPDDLVARWGRVFPSLGAPIDLARVHCLAVNGKVERARAVLTEAAPSASPRFVAWRAQLGEDLRRRESSADDHAPR